MNQSNIQAIKESLLAGDEYGILLYEKDSRLALYRNVYKMKEVKEYQDDIHIYYEKKDGSVHGLSLNRDIYESFMLLPFIGHIDDEPLYTGQRITYKGVDLAVTYQDNGTIYFLDGDSNDLFGMSVTSFDNNYSEEKIVIHKEFMQDKNVLEEEKQKELGKLGNTLQNLSKSKDNTSAKTIVENEEIEELQEDTKKKFDEHDDVSIAKLGERFVYVCKDNSRGTFDIIETVFVGAQVSKGSTKYNRKTVTLEQLEKLLKLGDLKFVTGEEMMTFAREAMRG